MKIIDFIKRRYSPRGSYTSFTNTGEDLLLQQALLKFNINKPTYIDIGCHHPIFGNITYLLYKNGGTGILVEPNKNLCKVISRKRSRDVCVFGGIGKNSEGSSFYEFKRSTRSTFLKNQADEWKKVSGQEYTTSTVPLYTLDKVIEKFNKDTAVDLISIDTEGYEEEILSEFKWLKLPKVFCIETAGKKDYFNDLLKSHNYTVFADTPANTIYTLNNTK